MKTLVHHEEDDHQILVNFDGTKYWITINSYTMEFVPGQEEEKQEHELQPIQIGCGTIVLALMIPLVLMLLLASGC